MHRAYKILKLGLNECQLLKISRNIRVPTFSSLQFKSSVHDSFSIYCPSKKKKKKNVMKF